ncbi:MAG: flavin reductase [Actinobacteria bacterium]|nr:MAG: flavin reductase [Actinomycetota bacterium]
MRPVGRRATPAGAPTRGDAAPIGGDVARAALRRFASGVTVLTVADGGLAHGTTVSALVAVSREPLVLGACLRASSSFTRLVRRASMFSVNVLRADQARVAARFADPLRRPGPSQFASLAWRTDPVTGAPLVEDCLAHLSCRMNGCVPVGDHDVIIAEVIDGCPSTGTPLLSFAGQLHSAPMARVEKE